MNDLLEVPLNLIMRMDMYILLFPGHEFHIINGGTNYRQQPTTTDNNRQQPTTGL